MSKSYYITALLQYNVKYILQNFCNIKIENLFKQTENHK